MDTVPIDFSTFTRSWVDLDAFFGRLATLPTDAETFGKRYGVFDDTDTQARDALFSDLAKLARIRDNLGGPASLATAITHNAALLQGDMPKDDAYTGVTWLTARCEQLAAKIIADYAKLPALLDAPGSNDDKITQVKQLLVGADGLVPEAVRIKASSMELSSAMAEDCTALSQTYASFNKTPLPRLANEALGGLRAKLGSLQKQLLSARDKADSFWLGRSDAQQQVPLLESEILQLETEQSCKQQLTEDFDGLFRLGNKAVNELLITRALVDRIGEEFANKRSLWMVTAQAANASQLTDSAWLSQALELNSTVQDMKALQASAKAYLQQSTHGRTELKDENRETQVLL